MFTTLIVQPIFNVLVLIYALLPGHNFGVAIILFTILTRIALYPMLKKQLKHTKSMRDLQPELKRIKKASKGDRQQESVMMMELYKEKEIKPLSYIGLMVLQIVLFLALFSGLNRVVNDPSQLVSFSYQPIQNLSLMQELSADISKFDNTLFGFIDLSRPAFTPSMGLYIPAMFLVLGSALIQFFQIKQTLPNDKNARKLREILRDAKTGKEADSSEMNAAMGRNIAYFMPIMIFVLTIGFAGALSLYWFVGGIIAYIQQSRLLKQDEYALEQVSAEVISKKPLSKEPKTEKKKESKKAEVVVTRRTAGEAKTAKATKSKRSSKKSTSKAKKRRS